ncbi:MAG: family 78 glycoside hydrolase catalytic domain, partial [Bryobacteraceae bacterium]|nr:family 78 glycoside hydrolase catalytic domain [Bryobacteraceae bacterium]
MIFTSFLGFSFAVLLLTIAPALTGAVRAVNLRTEYRVNPLGVDSQRPRLSWVLESAENGQRQSAYQILVSSRAPLLERGSGDLWDSGKVASAQTAQIKYNGKPLLSCRQYFWKVRIWDGSGQASDWSEPAEWTMGILQSSEWKAGWIAARTSPITSGPLPIFRREFDVSKPARRALVHASGVGFFELYLNGVKVSDEVLAPLWTNYRRTVFYRTYDVTRLLKPGRNAFAAMVGNGFYNVIGGRYAKFTGSFGPPAFLMQARIEHVDDTIAEVLTDGSWKSTFGPIVFSCIHGGEDYDARKEADGWMLPGFDDSKWRRAGYDGAPGGRLRAQYAPPIKVGETFKTVKVTEPERGVRVYDLGQNFAGWPKIRVRGKAGSQIRMNTGEWLDAKGFVDQRSAGGSGISFSYTLKGAGVEEWHPRFSYTGFRYVQVTGDADVLSLEGDFVYSSAPRVGEFRSSNELFNRIDRLVDAAVRSNLQAVLTDCPHREKLGWLEVAHLMGPSILYKYDTVTFFTKVAADTREAQLDDGMVPDIAPEYTVFRGGFRDSPEWGSAAVAIPWLLYRWFGDTRVVADSYQTMGRYQQYLASTASDGVVSHGLGDWYDIGAGPPGPSQATPAGITGTAIYYQDLDILRQAAALLGKTEDAARYAKLAAATRRRFHAKFFDAAKGRYSTGSQTAQATPLVLGMVPQQFRARVLDALVQDVKSRGNQQTSGDVGFRYLVRTLTDGGRSDVLFDMTNREDPPGYGSQLKAGGTALSEYWEADVSRSQNHCMLGHIQEWFMSGILGIGQAPDSVGFERIVIRPAVVGDLTSASGYYDSIRGRIESSWTLDGDTLRLRVRIPPNTTATVFEPGKDA